MSDQTLIRRARIAVACLCVVIVADLVAVLADYRLLQALRARTTGAGIATGSVEMEEGFAAFMALVQLAAVLLTAIFFLRWFHRAYASLGELGESGLKYSPRWAVGGFFVPILNLFRPREVMMELWTRASRLWSERRELVAGQGPPKKIVDAWWMTFLAASILGNVAGRMALNAEERLAQILATRVGLAADVVDLAAALVAIALVRNVSRLLAPLLRGAARTSPAPL